MYYIKEPYLTKNMLITIVGGERVNLLGREVEITLGGDRTGPPRTTTVRGATQDDYKALMDGPGKWDKIIGFEPDRSVLQDQFQEEE